MTPWTITQKPGFWAEFIDLNKDLQQSATGALKELETDAITPRGDTIKKLKGWENVYRYRLGSYRMLYAANLQARMVQLLAIGPHSNVYRRFNFPGWDAPDTAVPNAYAWPHNLTDKQILEHLLALNLERVAAHP